MNVEETIVADRRVDGGIIYETVFGIDEEDSCGYYPNQESAPKHVFNRSLLEFTEQGIKEVKERVALFKADEKSARETSSLPK